MITSLHDANIHTFSNLASFILVSWRNLFLLACYMVYNLIYTENTVVAIFAKWSSFLQKSQYYKGAGNECSWGKHIFFNTFLKALLFWRCFDFQCKSIFETCLCPSRMQMVLPFFPWSELYYHLTTVACCSHHHSFLRRLCDLEMSHLYFLSLQITPRIKVQLRLLEIHSCSWIAKWAPKVNMLNRQKTISQKTWLSTCTVSALIAFTSQLLLT